MIYKCYQKWQKLQTKYGNYEIVQGKKKKEKKKKEKKKEDTTTKQKGKKKERHAMAAPSYIIVR